jgi:N-hydroxyarylamine O-acetyltransferase
MLGHMDVDAYLARLGASRATDLGDLHRLHQTAVPFENLSIHLGERISLSVNDLFDKIVVRRRGGFCYELNGLFGELLSALGHTVTRLAARVGDGPPFDHLALLVDDAWLVDVGFGSHSTYPLRLDDRSPQDDPGGKFTLSDGPSDDVSVYKDGKLEYVLERRARVLRDFVPTCWWQATSPDSHFTEKPVCTRLTDDGRVTISERTLIVTTGAGRSETVLDGDRDLLAAYRDHFGIDLDRVPAVTR